MPEQNRLLRYGNEGQVSDEVAVNAVRCCETLKAAVVLLKRKFLAALKLSC